MQINIGEAKDRLSQPVSAAERGEEVVIARAGRPSVRLVAIDDVAHAKAAEQARRASAFGMFRATANNAAIGKALAPLSD